MSGREAALRQQQQLQERRDDPQGGEGAAGRSGRAVPAARRAARSCRVSFVGLCAQERDGGAEENNRRQRDHQRG